MTLEKISRNIIGSSESTGGVDESGKSAVGVDESGESFGGVDG